MSAYPPPPGFENSNTTAQTSSLPARPPGPNRGFKPAFPPSGSSSGPTQSSGGRQGFTGFAPRAIASSSRPYRSSSPTVNTGPQQAATYDGQSTYNGAGYQNGYQSRGYYPQSYQNDYAQPTPPHIRNPFAPPTASSVGAGGHGSQMSADPEMEAQIAQWQSAYMSKDDTKANPKSGNTAAGNNVSGTTASREGGESKTPTATASKPLTVQRSGGGQKWSDSSLLEWDPAHHRIFVGNLAGEVTDDSLLKAFAKYSSVQKARVIRDKVTTKSRGYGFVSFSDSDDYFKAARDMQGKYIGGHPVKIKKSTTEIKPVVQRDNRHNNKKGFKGNSREQSASQNGVLGPTGGGITKKSSKTKGGLKLLG